MKINTSGSFLSAEKLKKKSGEFFHLSKVLLDSDELVTVYSEELPDFERGEIAQITLNINLEKNSIFTSFV